MIRKVGAPLALCTTSLNYMSRRPGFSRDRLSGWYIINLVIAKGISLHRPPAGSIQDELDQPFPVPPIHGAPGRIHPVSGDDILQFLFGEFVQPPDQFCLIFLDQG